MKIKKTCRNCKVTLDLMRVAYARSIAIEIRNITELKKQLKGQKNV